MKLSLIPWHWKALAATAVLGGAALLIQRQAVSYGNDRAREAVAPWLAAQTTWKATRAANDATNLRLNATIEASNAQARAAIAARDDVERMLEATRDRARRLEEAHRLAIADATSRVAASSAEVARLIEQVADARAAADRDLSAYDKAAQRDAVNFTDLQAQVRPWVVVAP